MHRGGKFSTLLCLFFLLFFSTGYVRANQEENPTQPLNQQSVVSRVSEWGPRDDPPQSPDDEGESSGIDDGVQKRALSARELLHFFLMAMHDQGDSVGDYAGGYSSGGIPFRPVRRMGSEFLGKRSAEDTIDLHLGDFPDIYEEPEDEGSTSEDVWYPEKRRMGSEFLGKRRMGSEFLGKRRMGSEFLGKRRMGSEFLGKRRMGSEFLGKRRMGSEFLGKRRMGSEFLGKRRMGSEFLGKRRMGSEFLGKRSVGPAESNSAEERSHNPTSLTDGDRRKRSE